MKSESNRLAALLLCLAAAAGCERSDRSDLVPDQPLEPTTTARQATAGAEYADEDLPVAPDFEAEAERRITAANYEVELQAIEEAMGIDAGSDDADDQEPAGEEDEEPLDPTVPSPPVSPSPPSRPAEPTKPAPPTQPTRPAPPAQPADPVYD